MELDQKIFNSINEVDLLIHINLLNISNAFIEPLIDNTKSHTNLHKIFCLYLILYVIIWENFLQTASFNQKKNIAVTNIFYSYLIQYTLHLLILLDISWCFTQLVCWIERLLFATMQDTGTLHCFWGIKKINVLWISWYIWIKICQLWILQCPQLPSLHCSLRLHSSSLACPKLPSPSFHSPLLPILFLTFILAPPHPFPNSCNLLGISRPEG